MSARHILIVLTSHAQLGATGHPTGLWLEELAVPYQAFTQAGAVVELASPLGGRAPIDPRSQKDPPPAVAAFLADSEAQRKVAQTQKLADVHGRYDAVFIAGGHGTMFDLPASAPLAELLSRTYAAGQIVAAVCHGPAGLVAAKKPNGEPLVRGHRLTAFSNAEEDAVALTKEMPFPLETRLREQGARYEQAPLWQPFAVVDGQLITGQNPASSAAVAEAVLKALR